MEYIIEYLVITPILIFFSFCVNKRKKGQAVGIILFITTVYSIYSASLPFISDRYNFAMQFTTGYPSWLNSLKVVFTQTRLEYGFALLNYGLRLVTDNARIYFFFATFIAIIGALILIYTQCESFGKAFLLLVCSWYPYVSLYAIRQMIAVGFVCIALAGYLNKKKGQTIAFIILGTLFHASTVFVVIPLILNLCIKSNRTVKVLSVTLVALSGLFLPAIMWAYQNIPIFENLFLGSIDTNTTSASVVMKGLPCFLELFIGLFAMESIDDQQEEKKFQLYMLMTAFSAMPWILALYNYWLYRLNWFFTIPRILLLKDTYYYYRSRITPLIVCGTAFISYVLMLREMFMFFGL